MIIPLLLAQAVATPLDVQDTVLSFPPPQVFVEDIPNDDGTALKVRVVASDTAGLVSLLVQRREGETWKTVGEVIPGEDFHDTGLHPNRSYAYRAVAVYRLGGAEIQRPSEAVEGIPRRSWFHRGRISAFVIFILFTLVFFYLYGRAQTDTRLFIRRIPGLDALDDAVGRATEMGRPILYTFGLGEMQDLATIASLAILKRVARKVAEYETRLIVPNYDPIVMTAAQEVVKEAYLEAGRPDLYNEDDIFFLTKDQFGYAAGVDGLMVRDHPGAVFLQGIFYAESLILAETGFAVGAIQVAGTTSITQLPFFIAACDYTLIGEEMYAASAYLTRQPVEVASIKAEDMGKMAFIAVILLGILLETFGIHVIRDFFALF